MKKIRKAGIYKRYSGFFVWSREMQEKFAVTSIS